MIVLARRNFFGFSFGAVAAVITTPPSWVYLARVSDPTREPEVAWFDQIMVVGTNGNYIHWQACPGEEIIGEMRPDLLRFSLPEPVRQAMIFGRDQHGTPT